VTSGTAIETTDYTLPSPQTVTFADGIDTQTITVTAASDSTTEGDVVTLTLTNPTGGATIGSISGSAITIVDVPTAFTLNNVTSGGSITTVNADFSDIVVLSTTSDGAIEVTSGSSITVDDVQLDTDNSDLVITLSGTPTLWDEITFTDAITSDEGAQISTQIWRFNGTTWVKQ